MGTQALTSISAKYCRLCADEISQGVLIFGPEGRRLNLASKIRKTLSILILEEDALPKKVCTDCCRRIETYWRFKESVVDAEEKLNSVAQNIRIGIRYNNSAGSGSKQAQPSAGTSNDDSPHEGENEVPTLQEELIDSENCDETSGAVVPDEERTELGYEGRHNVEPSNSTILKCGICGIVVSGTREKIDNHFTENHYQNGEPTSPVYQCLGCCKLSKNFDAVKKHMSSCSSQRTQEVKCMRCGKNFSSSSALFAHQQNENDCCNSQSFASSHTSSSVSSPEALGSCDDFSPPETMEQQEIPTLNIPVMNLPSRNLNSSVSAASVSPPALCRVPQPGNPSVVERQGTSSRVLSLVFEKNESVSTALKPSNETPDDSSTPIVLTQITNDKGANSDNEPSKPGNKDRNDKDGFWQCGVCDKILSTQSGYKAHVMCHKGKRFSCDICGLSYSQKATMKYHQKVHHFNAPKHFACSTCGQKFIDLKHLNTHMKIHSASLSNSECPVCQKTYRGVRRLRRHMKYHTEARKFSCSVCKKSFNTGLKLEDHKNVHLNRKPYGCPFCSTNVSNYGNYCKHIKRKHGAELSKTFKRKIPAPRQVYDSSNHNAHSSITSSGGLQSSQSYDSSHQSTQSTNSSQSSVPQTPTVGNDISTGQSSATRPLEHTHSVTSSTIQAQNQNNVSNLSNPSPRKAARLEGSVNGSATVTIVQEPSVHVSSQYSGSYNNQNIPPFSESHLNHSSHLIAHHDVSYENGSVNSNICDNVWTGSATGGPKNWIPSSVSGLELVNQTINHDLNSVSSSSNQNSSYNQIVSSASNHPMSIGVTSTTMIPHSSGSNQSLGFYSTQTITCGLTSSTVPTNYISNNNTHHSLNGSNGVSSSGTNGSIYQGSAAAPVLATHNASTNSAAINNTQNASVIHATSSQAYQKKPMELSCKVSNGTGASSINEALQDMPIELTKVFQRGPLELCVRHDFSQSSVDLSSNTEPGRAQLNIPTSYNPNCQRLDITERELMDLSGAFRQPIDLISKSDSENGQSSHNQISYSEGSLVDLSLRSSFSSQDHSTSTFLRELIDLSNRSEPFQNEELNLTLTSKNHSGGNHAAGQQQAHVPHGGQINSNTSSISNLIMPQSIPTVNHSLVHGSSRHQLATANSSSAMPCYSNINSNLSYSDHVYNYH